MGFQTGVAHLNCSKRCGFDITWIMANDDSDASFDEVQVLIVLACEVTKITCMS